ncbi:perilipin-3-like [Scyliorhinus canicula]|uniref:perilipin-3-like n=1 Tax=Scyliorhinus canicula TaxID=7830 RepID=UPI0018F2E07E|nr:perilipin-3-like [Scyliorhinus canicula]
MASEVAENIEVSKLSESQENGEQQNVVSRVTNLPLVSSAYDIVSAVYNSTKENHPYMKTVCDVAEQGVKTISAVAVSGAKPIMDKLEPQITAANEYACKGLDKLEEKLPILQQSTPQVVADTKELVSSTITGAKDAVSNTVTGVVDMAKGAVHGGIEKTKIAVAEGVNTVMASKVGQMVVTGVDSALNKSEEMVDHYLPMTEEELAKLATSVEGVEVAPAQSYYVRLGSLSSKVRHRAYQHSTSKMQQARQSSQDTMVQLHNAMDLIELAKKGVDSANQKLHGVQEKLHQTWADWQKKQPKGQVEGEETQKPEQLESQTLTMTRSLTQQLQTTCLTLVSNVHGLPRHIQEKMQQIRSTAENIHTSFSAANSFADLSGQLLAQSREQMLKIRESMDGVMDYVLHNTPLNWLVGPFAPQLPESEEIAMDVVQEMLPDLLGSSCTFRLHFSSYVTYLLALTFSCNMASTTEEQVPNTAESQESCNQQALVETGNLVTLTDVKDTAIEIVKSAAQGNLEKTKAAVGQLVATGVDISLLKSEELVDHYLPMTKEELAKVATPIEGSDTATGQGPSYYVRLGSLSLKVRNRAYECSIARMQKAKANGQETLSHLHNLVDLIEMAKQGAESTIKLQNIQAKLSQILLHWKKHQPGDLTEEELSEKPEQLESKSLVMTQNFSDQLQTICQTLASSVRGLPQNIEDQVQQVCKLAEEIYTSLSSATSFQDLSAPFLTQTKEQMLKIREGMDGVMDYLLHNTPLNWLVGPFIPQLAEDQESLPSTAMKPSDAVPQ